MTYTPLNKLKEKQIHYTISVDVELDQKVKTHLRENDTDRSKLVRAALKAYLGIL